MYKMDQASKEAWQWIENTDVGAITSDHIQTSYRLKIPICKPGKCKYVYSVFLIYIEVSNCCCMKKKLQDQSTMPCWIGRESLAGRFESSRRRTGGSLQCYAN